MKGLSLSATMRAGVIALQIAMGTQTVWSQQVKTALFKVITDKDEIVIGLTAPELEALGGPETSPAGRIAQALTTRRELTVWQYAVRKAGNGDLQVAPLHRIGLLANHSLRVEPYSTPLSVLEHD